MQTIKPGQQREIFLDLLRGFAILGIFIANLRAFSGYRFKSDNISPWLIEGWDQKMLFIHHWLIEGKFYSIFSFLFGWGMYLFIYPPSAETNPERIGLARRRLGFMLLLGFLHLLIWPGDIVFFYAVVGFLFLWMRHLSNRIMLITAAVLLLLPILLYALKMHFPAMGAPARYLEEAGIEASKYFTGVKDEESYRKFEENAGWWDHLKLNAGSMFFRFSDLVFQSRIPKVLAMFLVGFVVGRSGFFTKLTQYKKRLQLIVALGLLIGIPANYYLAWNMHHFPRDYYQLKTNGLYRTIAYALGVAPLALAYIGSFILLFQVPAILHKLKWLAPVGKMAFTNYVCHSFIGNFIFLQAGLGYEGQVGPVYYTLLALIVFMFQLIFSTVWLRYFEFGPLEWIWRSLTYGKMQAMVKRNKS